MEAADVGWPTKAPATQNHLAPQLFLHPTFPPVRDAVDPRDSPYFEEVFAKLPTGLVDMTRDNQIKMLEAGYEGPSYIKEVAYCSLDRDRLSSLVKAAGRLVCIEVFLYSSSFFTATICNKVAPDLPPTSLDWQLLYNDVLAAHDTITAKFLFQDMKNGITAILQSHPDSDNWSVEDDHERFKSLLLHHFETDTIKSIYSFVSHIIDFATILDDYPFEPVTPAVHFLETQFLTVGMLLISVIRKEASMASTYAAVNGYIDTEGRKLTLEVFTQVGNHDEFRYIDLDKFPVLEEAKTKAKLMTKNVPLLNRFLVKKRHTPRQWHTGIPMTPYTDPTEVSTPDDQAAMASPSVASARSGNDSSPYYPQAPEQPASPTFAAQVPLMSSPMDSSDNQTPTFRGTPEDQVRHPVADGGDQDGPVLYQLASKGRVRGLREMASISRHPSQTLEEDNGTDESEQSAGSGQWVWISHK